MTVDEENKNKTTDHSNRMTKNYLDFQPQLK